MWVNNENSQVIRILDNFFLRAEIRVINDDFVVKYTIILKQVKWYPK